MIMLIFSLLDYRAFPTQSECSLMRYILTGSKGKVSVLSLGPKLSIMASANLDIDAALETSFDWNHEIADSLVYLPTSAGKSNLDLYKQTNPCKLFNSAPMFQKYLFGLLSGTIRRCWCRSDLETHDWRDCRSLYLIYNFT